MEHKASRPMVSSLRALAFSGLCGVALPLSAMAQVQASPQHEAVERQRDERGFSPELMTEGFLAAHPDLRWRREGLRAYGEQDFPLALEYFTRAASFADKASQAILGQMHWDGLGTARDPALAYVWMDLAAERLYYDFLVQRERYWAGLTDAQRAEALTRGQALLAEYGDDVAKPRLEKILRREARNVTGSRVGFTGNLDIIPMTGPMAGTGMRISGDRYYAKEYWQPAAYWRMQDRLWKAPLRERVDVGELEQVREGE